jgi:epoxyqueuosine reductase
MGEWIFGCDVCQDVCPWNRKAPMTEKADFLPMRPLPEPTELLALDEAEFRTTFSGSPVRRAKRGGLLRSATVALGNRKDSQAVQALAQRLHDPDPVVRQHAAWALGQIGGGEVRAVLKTALVGEPDPTVSADLELALGRERP